MRQVNKEVINKYFQYIISNKDVIFLHYIFQFLNYISQFQQLVLVSFNQSFLHKLFVKQDLIKQILIYLKILDLNLSYLKYPFQQIFQMLQILIKPIQIVLHINIKLNLKVKFSTLQKHYFPLKLIRIFTYCIYYLHVYKISISHVFNGHVCTST